MSFPNSGTPDLSSHIFIYLFFGKMFLLKLKQKETVERLTDLNLKKEMNEENG